MEIFEISSLVFLSYDSEEEMKTDPIRKEIYQKIRNYYIALKHGFYFSHNYKLTLSLSQQHNSQYAPNFTWNRHLL